MYNARLPSPMRSHERLEEIGISQFLGLIAGLAHGERLIEHLADFLFAIRFYPYQGMGDVSLSSALRASETTRPSSV